MSLLLLWNFTCRLSNKTDKNLNDFEDENSHDEVSTSYNFFFVTDAAANINNKLEYLFMARFGGLLIFLI